MVIKNNITAPELDRVIIKAPEIKQEKSSFLPVLHGKATDAIANMAGSSIVENRLNNTGVVDTGKVKLVLDKFTELTGTLGVSTHKLLSTAVAEFTALNHTGSKTREASFYGISIPLKEYAFMCGYDVIEHETETPEEAQAEALRAKRTLDNARRKINKDLAILFSASLSWKEKVRGKQGDYMDIRLIEAKGIKRGNIQLVFSNTFGKYLIKLPLSQYPVALLSLDERNINAYVVGLKMVEHYSLDNNHIRGTAQLLKVKTLLAVTNLPSIDNISVKKNGWENRIKEPLETALDALTACELLADWRYSKSKGAELTDEEATSFTSYEEWENTLVYFALKDAPDHTARIEARQAKCKKKTAKKKEGD